MKTEWKIFFFYLLVIALITKPYVYGENEASRFNAIASIAEDKSLGWTSAYFWTDDRIHVNGKDYSDKPYAFAVISVPLYYLLYKIGISFSTYQGWATYLLKVLIVGVASSLLLVLFYRSVHELQEKQRIFLTLALGFATLILTYATAFNSHSIVALLLFAAFLSHIKFIKERTTNFLHLGLLLGLATAIDMVLGALFTIGYWLYYFFFTNIKNKEKAKIVFGFFLLFSIQLFCNYLIVGDPFIPAYGHPQYYIDAGTWQNETNLPGFYNHESLTDFLTFTFNSTFGARGFFSHTPILLFGLLILITLTFRKKSIAYLPIIFAVFATIGFYCIYMTNYGGASYGLRYYLPLTPILVYFCKYIFTDFQKYKKLFYIATCISFIVAVVGSFNPWVNHFVAGSQISFIANLQWENVYNTAGHYILHTLLPWWF